MVHSSTNGYCSSLLFESLLPLLLLLLLFTTVNIGHRSMVDANVVSKITTWKKNLNHQQTVDYMHQLQQQYPNLLKLISIGNSVQGNDLWIMIISTEPNIRLLETKDDLYRYYDESRILLRPTVKLISTIHGNEPLGKQLLLALATFILENYSNNNTVVQRLLNTTNLELLPLMNPDGFRIATEGDCNGIRTPKHSWNGWENANKVDLNEDFKITVDDKESFKNVQPETVAVMTWIVNNPSFVLSASLHTGLKVIAYPFDSVDSITPDDVLFKTLAKNYVDNRNDSDSFKDGCSPGDRFSDGISIGNEIGPREFRKNVTMPDFNYINTNCLELDLHLSCCKYPNSSQIEPEWNNNRESFLKFIESAHWGVKGLITDKNTQNPIKSAMISVKNFGHNITSSNRGEYWRVLLPGRHTITVSAFGYDTITKNVTVTNWNTTSALIVNFELSPKADVLEKEETDHDDTLPDFRTPTKFVHHNYERMERLLKELHRNYSKITRLYSIGKSTEKRELYVLEITDNPGQHELLEPEFKYVANMHGNEVVGREMILLFAKLLLENYGHHPMVDHLVNNTRIHLMPSMNPDGYERSKLGDCDSLHGRGNANNVDLNRNFPDQYKTYRENREQEVETLLVMQWLKQYPFVLSANLHGGALVANYPFDGNNRTDGQDGYNGTPDDKLFKHLALIYSKNHPHMHKGHCYKKCADNELSNEYYPNGIINGAYWYTLYGGMQDWNYLHTNCFEITIELGCQKYPLAKELPRLWQENRRPLLVFINEVHRGIKGVIRDAHTNGSIVDAEIHVNGTEHVVRSVSPYGDYWRLLLPGVYLVNVTKNGYQSSSRIVAVENRTDCALRMDFILKPVSNSSSENGFMIFTMVLLVLFSILFFTFCMSIVWCPSYALALLNRNKLFGLICLDCDIGKFLSTTIINQTNGAANKSNKFYYSKLNIEDDFPRDLSDDDEDEINLNLNLN